LDAIAVAVEKAEPQLLLHLRDRSRHCRLRNRKFSSGFRHAAPQCYDKQDMQITQFEAAPGSLDRLHVRSYQNGYGVLKQ
jgi:hypothetical protein